MDDQLNFLEYVCNIKRTEINIKEVLIYLRLIFTPKVKFRSEKSFSTTKQGFGVVKKDKGPRRERLYSRQLRQVLSTKETSKSYFEHGMSNIQTTQKPKQLTTLTYTSAVKRLIYQNNLTLQDSLSTKKLFFDQNAEREINEQIAKKEKSLENLVKAYNAY